jgi:uncharacterized protein (TIGR01777 family)
MPQNILITGGTGLVGTHLAQVLTAKGYVVSMLSRSPKKSQNITYYQWDLSKNKLDEQAILKADYIVHLAGANVGEGRWTAARKKEIIESRTKSSQLIGEKLRTLPHHVKAVIAAAGVGIYGETGVSPISEEEPINAQDFLAKVCVAWEKSIKEATTNSVERTVILRMGVVLSAQGGALEKIARPVRYCVGAALGSGEQYISWIHIEDLCNLFIKAIEDSSLSGVYNAVAPNAVTNQTLTQSIAQILHKPLFLPNVPVFVLRMMLGEMANIVLIGSNASAQKLLATGFKFKFQNIQNALQDLLQ